MLCVICFQLYAELLSWHLLMIEAFTLVMYLSYYVYVYCFDKILDNVRFNMLYTHQYDNNYIEQRL